MAYELKVRIYPKRPKRLNKATRRFKPEMKKALIESGELIQKEAKGKAPVRTGALRRSLEYSVKKLKQGWSLIVGSGVKTGRSVPYARKQDERTKYLTGTLRNTYKAVQGIIRKHTRKLFR